MTHFRFLEDMFSLAGNAKVVSIAPWETGGMAVVLDGTLFYPQGGGQPYDTGFLESRSGKFQVKEVRKQDGEVFHVGEFVLGKFVPGETIEMQVDANRRLLNSQLHTAGHVVDVALVKAGYDFESNKGYHFPDGPYVEYMGEIPAENMEAARQAIETTANEVVQVGGDVRVQSVPKSEVAALCKYVPDYLTDDQPVRVITVFGERGCPCGGTHVKNITHVGHISIPKIKNKGGKLRVSYTIQPHA